MEGEPSRRDLGKFLCCSSLLEEKVAKAYEHLSKLVDNRLISNLLSFIAHDSFKHAECFRAAAELLTGFTEEVPFEVCGEICGEYWKTLIVDAEKFLDKREISVGELSALIRGLMNLERFVAEEYLTIIYVRLAELMVDESGIGLENLRVMLKWIVEDEERHRQILEIIEKMLAGK